MPLYIGKIVDYMAEKDFESVSTLTSYMLIVIAVSWLGYYLSLQIKTDF